MAKYFVPLRSSTETISTPSAGTGNADSSSPIAATAAALNFGFGLDLSFDSAAAGSGVATRRGLGRGGPPARGVRLACRGNRRLNR